MEASFTHQFWNKSRNLIWFEKINKFSKRSSFCYLIFFFISAREATILHTLKYILYIFLFYNWMDIWLVILYMVINQGYIIIVIFKFTFSYHFIETANLKSQLFHNNFFADKFLLFLISLTGSIKINLAQYFSQQVKIVQLFWVFCSSK